MTKRFTATTSRILHLFATLGPIGYLPFAPGTYGSALTCIVIYCFPSLCTHPLFIAVVTLVALLALNSLTFDAKDPGYVVIDEAAGMFVAMAWQSVTLTSLLAGFVLFRFFDIVKPYPIKRVETFRKGYGILADDILAGVFANLLLIAGRRVLSW